MIYNTALHAISGPDCAANDFAMCTAGNEHKAVTECSSSNSDVEVYCESAQPNKKHQGDTEYVYVDEERVFGESKDADQAKGDEAEKLAVPSEVKVDQHESNVGRLFAAATIAQLVFIVICTTDRV